MAGTAAGPLPAVRLRSGTVGEGGLASITWCNPGAVVRVSLGSARSWMVPLPPEHIELLMCLRECSGSFRGRMFWWRAGGERKAAETFGETWSELKHAIR
jgi:hypothetical protein